MRGELCAESRRCRAIKVRDQLMLTENGIALEVREFTEEASKAREMVCCARVMVCSEYGNESNGRFLRSSSL